MKKRVMMLLLAATMGLAMMGCQSSDGGDGDKASESNKSQTEEDGTSGSNLEGTVTLAAAASLEYAFEEELIPAFEEQYPDVNIEGVYDSSGKLQQQIESGLAADLFFSAAPTQMNALEEEGMIDSDTIVNLLENKIVLITPASSDAEFSSFEDIANAGTIAVGDPESVPVGQYAQESLTNLGLWDTVSAKASFGTNVTEVLNWVWVAESSADCGIVYATDAATTDKVKVVVEAPADSLESPVLYPVAMTKDAPNQEAARAFYDFIISDDAVSVFESYGFADYRSAELQEEQEMDFSPVWISLKTTVCASVITFVIGILAAWAVMFIKGRKLKAAVDGILTIPLVLPPTVAGFFLLWLFGARRPIGSFVEEVFGFRIAFSWVATVLSAVVVSFPLMYRSAKAGFEQIDQNMIEEAKMLGLGKWGILWKILFPCTFPSILSGMILSTTRGLGEYWATAMLAGNIRQDKDPACCLFGSCRRKYGPGGSVRGSNSGYCVSVCLGNEYDDTSRA